MQKNSQNNFELDSVSLLGFFLQKRKPLLIIFSISLIAGIVVSFLIDYKYKSSVVMFPASSANISEVLLTKNLAAKDVMAFGEEETVEQMIQILKSEKLKTKIIQKYDLLHHYHLENAKYPQTRLNEKYKDNISFIRTKYLSVVVEVYDVDKNYASGIANDIAAYYDSVMTSLHRERAVKAFDIVKKEYLNLEQEIKTLRDSLTKLQEFGVFDFESQSEVLNRAYSNAILTGNTKAEKKLQTQLDNLAKYGSAHMAISNLLEYELLRLSDLKAKYTEAKVNLEQDLPYKFIVSQAYPAEKKSYPIRWLVIFIVTFSGTLFGLILLILLSSSKKMLK